MCTLPVALSRACVGDVSAERCSPGDAISFSGIPTSPKVNPNPGTERRKFHHIVRGNVTQVSNE